MYRVSPRHLKIFILVLALLVVLTTKHLLTYGGPRTGHPPSYEELREWDKNLPQHNPDAPFPEGRTGRYVKFSYQATKHGWNNVLNEM